MTGSLEGELGWEGGGGGRGGGGGNGTDVASVPGS